MEADCGIGAVKKLKGAIAKTGKVAKQEPKPGTARAPGAPVAITLGA